MEDTLYTATKFIAPRRVMYLPFGGHYAVDRAIYYHFYHLPEGADPAPRLLSASHWLEKQSIVRFERDEADRIINALLLGFVQKSQESVRAVLKEGKEQSVVDSAIRSGQLSPTLKSALGSDDFPFKQSPLVGKTIVEIAKSAAATTVFVIAVSGENAPIAIILTPVGIVAIHVANRVKGRIAKKVDDLLRDLLK